MTHYLYLITRADGERYVGVTKDPHKRSLQHKRGQGNIHLKGKDFEMEILMSGKETEMYAYEQHAIEAYECSLNRTKGGSGGWTHDQNGENNHQSKLCDKDVIKIRELANNTNLTYSEIGKMFGVKQPTVSRIVTGKAWKRVEGPITKTPKRSHNGQSQKINNEIILKIIELRKQGFSYANIGKTLNISSTTAHKYAKNVITPSSYQTHKTLDPFLMSQIKSLRKEGHTYQKIATILGISCSVAYKYGK